MKYVVVLYDGMADYPVPALGGKTPMMCAKKPNMDYLAKRAEVGLIRTVAPGLKPGSDVANMSVLGFDPMKYYTGRSPLEAASIGIDMKPTDVSLRTNLVTLSEDDLPYEQKTIEDYCADDISTEEAEILIKYIDEKLGTDEFKFYPGVSYRHCLIWDNGTTDLGKMTPPHDITGKVITEYLSTSENAKPLIELMKKSYDLLKDHPVNLARKKAGKRPANSIWLWGEGKRPALSPFEEIYGIKGAVVSAVDLSKTGWQTFPLLAANFKQVGTAYVAVNNGSVTVTCEYNGFYVFEKSQCIKWFTSLDQISKAELLDISNGLACGSVVSIADDLGGASMAYLSINNKITWRNPVDDFGNSLPDYWKNLPQWKEYRANLMEMINAANAE